MTNSCKNDFNFGHGDHQHTPHNPDPHVRSSLLAPEQRVGREQSFVVIWSLLHIGSLLCLCLGVYFAHAYMMMPDRVIIMDESGSIYRGSSSHVLVRETAEDIARRCTLAFLDRSFEHDHWQLCEALFGRSAQKSLRSIIQKSKSEFSDRKIRQIPIIENIRLSTPGNAPGQCLAFVSGKLHRDGIYMKMPYSQKLEFTLGLRLVRSTEQRSFPLRVLRMAYEERSIYENSNVRKD